MVIYIYSILNKVCYAAHYGAHRECLLFVRCFVNRGARRARRWEDAVARSCDGGANKVNVCRAPTIIYPFLHMIQINNGSRANSAGRVVKKKSENKIQ